MGGAPRPVHTHPGQTGQVGIFIDTEIGLGLSIVCAGLGRPAADPDHDPAPHVRHPGRRRPPPTWVGLPIARTSPTNYLLVTGLVVARRSRWSAVGRARQRTLRAHRGRPRADRHRAAARLPPQPREPNYEVILAWDPRRCRRLGAAVRPRWLAHNSIRAALTWTRVAAFLARRLPLPGHRPVVTSGVAHPAATAPRPADRSWDHGAPGGAPAGRSHTAGRQDDPKRRAGPAASRDRPGRGRAGTGRHRRAAARRTAGLPGGPRSPAARRVLGLRHHLGLRRCGVLGAAYDVEAEHNRVRREMFAPLCAQIARVQFEA